MKATISSGRRYGNSFTEVVTDTRVETLFGVIVWKNMMVALYAKIEADIIQRGQWQRYERILKNYYGNFCLMYNFFRLILI